MKIKEIKEIAKNRSRGNWRFISNLHGYQISNEKDYTIKGTWTSWDSEKNDDSDAKFSAMAANVFDSFLQIVEAVKSDDSERAKQLAKFFED